MTAHANVMTAGAPDVSVVVPLHNEEENIHELVRRTTEVLDRLGHDYELVLVDDGSTDATAEMLRMLREGDPHIVPLHLSRNFGHQAAVCAGIDAALGRAVIVMDGDLQDPPELFEEFLQRWQAGFDVVYAVRRRRQENLLKRTGYFLFYRLLRAISDLDIPLDSGDFCLMDRRVVDVLKHLPERQRFVRGLRTFVGFRQCGVAYDRPAREAGVPKYTLLALAATGPGWAGQLQQLAVNVGGLPGCLFGRAGPVADAVDAAGRQVRSGDAPRLDEHDDCGAVHGFAPPVHAGDHGCLPAAHFPRMQGPAHLHPPRRLGSGAGASTTSAQAETPSDDVQLLARRERSRFIVSRSRGSLDSGRPS